MRSKTRLRFVSLFMIALVIALPVAFAQNMTNQTAAATAGEISLEVTAPAFSKSKYVDIGGMTAPNARLEYYAGPTKVKVSRAGSDGKFITQRIPLVKTGENDLIIKASVEDKAAQKSFTIIYDPNPPELKLSEIPEFTTKTALAVHGDVTEPVTIRWASYPKKDDEAPLIVAGLEARDMQKNQVTLVWTPSDDADLLEYAVYRDGKLVGVSRTAIFIDNNVASGKEYKYQVSAVDTSCNEGVKSAAQKAATPAGGSDEEKIPAADLSCRPVYQVFDTAVPFDITIPLQAGRNVVEINAMDKAGNIAKVGKFVTVDVGPPQFLTTNLEAAGTTYIPEFTVRGNLSEKATVFVYINDDTQPSYFALTDDNGNFDIDIKLRSDVEVQAGQAAELDTGVGWKNKIKLKAVDLAGQEAWYPGQQQYKEVIWAVCGYGAWLDFDVEEVTPRILTPRLLMQGIQQIGVPFTLKYIGGQQKAEIAGVVNAVPVRVSPDLEKDFDNDKISSPQVWIRPRSGEAGVWDGYVQINFVEWPVEQLEIEGNETASAIEKAISSWRRGEFHEAGVSERGVYMKPKCLDPALGCLRLYLEIDIPLKEQVRIYNPQTMQETFEWKTVRQRNCLPLIMEIDQVIPPDVIRKDALKATSKFFGNAIELIDSILDPLKTFTENVVYTCLATSVVVFGMSVAKRIGCSRLLSVVGLAEEYDPLIAEAGLCRLAYGGPEEQAGKDRQWAKNAGLKKTDQYRSCKSCQDATKSYRDIVQDVYEPICDRIACPSAPTLQKYILENKNKKTDITSNIEKNLKDEKETDRAVRAKRIIENWGVKGKVFSGSSCGFYPDFISSGYTVSMADHEEGHACASDYECRAGLSCVNNVCAYVARERAKRGEGESCTDDTGCEAGLYCNEFSHTCTKSTEIRSKLGEICGAVMPCEEGLVCDEILGRCVVPTTGPRALAKQGEDCGEDSDCESGLKCSVFGNCYKPENAQKAEKGVGEEVEVPETSGLASTGSSFDSFNLVTGAASTIDVLNSFATGSAIAGADTAPAAGAGASAGSAATAAPAAAPSAGAICGITIGKAPIGAGGKVGVKELYEIYRGDYEEIKNKCTNQTLHPACPLCCGYDYMWDWNSACGFGNIAGSASYSRPDLDTFNEIKESAKLAAEKVGRGDDIGGGGIFSIFNALSGFCTSAGNPTPDVVRTGLNFNPAIAEAEENLMQVFVFPESGSGDSFKYRIYRGYLAKSFVIDNAVTAGKLKGLKTEDRYSFSKTLEAIKESELTKYFQNLGTEKEAADKKEFAAEFCKPFEGGKGFSGKICESAAPDIFGKVKDHIGAVEDEYIIKPSDGMWNSVRCICLSSLVAYLEKWRQIAQAIKNCVDVIILTGDGDEGMCRSLLSNYVCDLLWEIITCFANKWNAPSGKRVSADPVGDVLGILTGAGTDVANEVQGRYGETAMFNAMFNEKELVHGLCLLAFGMEWNLDVSAMVKQGIESVPVDTIVLGPTPAQARFIAWNPVTNPRGLTTWEYHFGLMISAGSDINARIKLKCSTGYGCSETDGFVGGECDCNKVGTAQVISINPTCTPRWKSRITKNELMSYDCSYTVQQGKYRFDTMIFEYDYQDPGTKQSVTKTSESGLNRVGSEPPSFCRFDAFSLSFRCKFGEDPSGIKIEKVEPTYEYMSLDRTAEVFAMDKDLNFELSIRQQLPEVEAEMATGVKFLGYKLVNSAGTVIDELEPKTDEFLQTDELKTDGSYKRERVIISPQADWKSFFAKGGLVGSQFQLDVFALNNVPVQNYLKANIQDYVDGVDITATKDGKAEFPDKQFVIDIKKTDLGVYLVQTKQVRGSAAVGDDNILGTREPIEAGKRYTRTYTDDKGVKYDVTFRLKKKDKLDQAEQIQFFLGRVPGVASGDPCVTKSPDTWKITFTAYNADKYGSVSDQVAVDPETGESQSKTIPFKIVCAKATELPAKGAAVAPGTGLIAAPYWFVEDVGVIDFKDGVATVPEGRHSLIAGTYSKGAVEVVMQEKDGASKIYNMQSIQFDDVPESIQKEVAIIKETGDFFYSFITVEKGKEYAMKVTFRQPDGKVIDSKEYTVKAQETIVTPVSREAPPGIGEITNIELVASPSGKKVYKEKDGKNYVFNIGLDTDTFELRVYAKGPVTGMGYASAYKQVDKLDPYFVLDKSKGWQVLGSEKQIAIYDKDDRKLDSAWIKYDHAIKKAEIYDGAKKIADLSTAETVPTLIEKGKTYTLGIDTIPLKNSILQARISETMVTASRISDTSFRIRDVYENEIGKHKITIYLMEENNPAAVAVRDYWYEVVVPLEEVNCNEITACYSYKTSAQCDADTCKLNCAYWDSSCRSIAWCKDLVDCRDYTTYGATEATCKKDPCKKGCKWDAENYICVSAS